MKQKGKLLSLLCVPFMLIGCSEGGKTGEDPIDNPTNNSGNETDNGQNQNNNDHTHSFEEKWSTSATQHWHKCTGTGCKEKQDAADHTFGEWVIDSYAKDVTVSNNWGGSQTEKQNGVKHRVCSVCNYQATGAVEEYDPSVFDPTRVPEPSGKYTPTFDRDYHIFDKGAPVIKFQVTDDTKGGTSTDFATKPRKSSNIESWEVKGKYTLDNLDNIDYEIGEVTGGMKVRGNFTTDYEKKGLRIKFDNKQNLFGLNGGKKFSKWVLFADVKDNAMLRNAMSFYIAQNMVGDNVFVTDFTPVHLYINNQYWGLYLLGEQKENKKGRIQTAALPADNYAGTDIGYTFELDKYATEEEAKGLDGDPTFTMNYSPTLSYKPHEGENRYQCNTFTNTYTMLTDISNRETQLPYIKNRAEMAYKVIYYATKSNKFYEIKDEKLVDSTATSAEECLAKTIDIDSFVDFYIMNEIVCDPDIGYSSFYLSLDMSAEGDHKLRMDCPWDFDSTLGVRKGTLEDAQGMYASKSSNVWFSMISNTNWFKEKVKAKWNQLRENQLFEKAMNMIEDFSINYVQDYKKNYERWPKTLGSNTETNHETRAIVQRLKSERQAEQLLYHWFADRIDFLETQWGTGRNSILGGAISSGGTSTGGTTTENPGENPDGQVVVPAVDYTEFKAAANKVRIEAETGTLDGKCVVKNKEGEGISSNSYVGDLNPSGGSVTFTYNAAKAGEAVLTVGLSARTGMAYKLTDLFDISVNGSPVSSDTTVAQGNGTDYHCWTEVDAAKVNLLSGNNTIVFTAKATSTNFDYIDLYVAK